MDPDAWLWREIHGRVATNKLAPDATKLFPEDPLFVIMWRAEAKIYFTRLACVPLHDSIARMIVYQVHVLRFVCIAFFLP